MFVYIVVAFFVYELSSIGSPACFGDCFEYIALMQESGPEFFHTMLTMFRPWAVPTFFSLFGAFEISSAARIVLAQTYIAFLSWLLFAYACQGMFATRALKFVGFVLLSSLMFGQGYYHFNQFLLSDSLAMSSVLMQYALVFLFPRFANFCEKVDHGRTYIVLYLAVIFIVTAFEMATRDANIMLGLSGVAFLLFANRNARSATKRGGFRDVRLRRGVRSILGRPDALSGKREKYPGGGGVRERRHAAFLFKAWHAGQFRRGRRWMRSRKASTRSTSMKSTKLRRRSRAPSRGPRKQKFLGGVGGVYAMYFLTHPAYVIGNVARHWRLIFTQTEDLEATIDRGAFGKPGARKFVRPGKTTPFIAGASARLP